MSDYLDQEAQESEDEEDLTEQERRRLKRVRAESDDDEEDGKQTLSPDPCHGLTNLNTMIKHFLACSEKILTSNSVDHFEITV
jgi:hypothetical protein